MDGCLLDGYPSIGNPAAGGMIGRQTIYSAARPPSSHAARHLLAVSASTGKVVNDSSGHCRFMVVHGTRRSNSKATCDLRWSSVVTVVTAFRLYISRQAVGKQGISSPSTDRISIPSRDKQSAIPAMSDDGVI